MISAPGITVNGIAITPDQINQETQYHHASSMPEAKYHAMQALVIRELLIQRAVYCCLCSREFALKSPDEAIGKLLEKEVCTPEPKQRECKKYYLENREKFKTRPLFEVSHIFYPAPARDKKARSKALGCANAALDRIHRNPALFETIAQAESACSSAQTGGFLGQIGAGQTVPAFESALLAMKEGEISKDPVETEVGYHIIRIHRRAEGKPLPKEPVMDWIADYLRNESWRRIFRHYVLKLASEAKISGFRFAGDGTPLVQ